MRGQPTFHLFQFKSEGRHKFGPIWNRYRSFWRQNDDVIMTSSSYMQRNLYFLKVLMMLYYHAKNWGHAMFFLGF